MNPDRTHPEEVKFEQDLRAIRTRWRSEEADEPPGLLDQAVLNAARREVGGDTGRQRLRWLGGFATAVVVVVAASLVLQQMEFEGPAPDLPNGDGFRLDAESPESRTTAVPEKPAPYAVQKREKAAAAAAPLVESYAAPGEAGSAESEPMAAAEWVERLLDLQRNGDVNRLADELAAFRNTYPDYPLPPELE